MRYSTWLALIGAAVLVCSPAIAQEAPGLMRLPSIEPVPAQCVLPAAYDLTSPVFGVPPLVTPAAAMELGGPEAPLVSDKPLETDYCGSCFYFQADALYWQRVGTGCDEVLVLNTTTGDPLLRTSNLFFDGTGGFRVTVGWRPDTCCPHCSAWELTYFGLFGDSANRTISGAGDLAIPGDLGLASNNFFLTDTLAIDYRSTLNNVELNCVKSCCLCCAQIDFLCGFRYINLSEDFIITGTDLQEGTSSYNIHTDNNLYGLQLGGRYTSQFSDCWSYQLVGKAGVFLNAVQQVQSATDFPTASAPFSLRDRIGDDGIAVASLGELDFFLIRRLNDIWSLRFGYSVLGIGGLALAPDQLDFTDTPTSGSSIQNFGWIFYHGVSLGVEARW